MTRPVRVASLVGPVFISVLRPSLRALALASLALSSFSALAAPPPPRPPTLPPALGDARPRYVPPPRPPTSAHPLYSTAPVSGVEQYGEVAILEGDDGIVSDDGAGGVSIVLSYLRNDAIAIANRFYTAFPDEFDELVVVATFPDSGSPDAIAWEYPAQQDVLGIGAAPDLPPTPWDDTAAWGATQHRLYAFVNMKGIDSYPGYDSGRPIDDPASMFQATLAHEFAHRWLAYPKYRDGDGRLSNALLGYQQSHWAPTVQTDGSVMGGNHWLQNDDGSYACLERAVRYSPLDLYLMGLASEDEVPPYFVIDGATLPSGKPLDPVSTEGYYYCGPATGTREDVTIAQIIDANGPRVPSYADAPKSFRVAFALLTRPGEHAADVVEQVARVDAARARFEQTFSDYSGGRGSVCTQLSAPCGAPTVQLLGVSLVEDGGNGNGLIEPGEPIAASFRVENTGPSALDSVAVTVSSAGARFDAPTQTVAALALGEHTELRFRGTFSDDPTLCNAPLTVHATATLGAAPDPRQVHGFVAAQAGALTVYQQPFDDDDGGFEPNRDGKDTALVDAWAWGEPQGYGYQGYFRFQPQGGAGGSGKAWFTGLDQGDLSPGGDTHSLSPGRATLWSPPLDLSQAPRPHLLYSAWFLAIDTTDQSGLVSADDDRLVLEGSNDGAKWFQLDVVDGVEDRWRPRDIDPASPVNGQRGLDLSRPVTLRFTANKSSRTDLVEAGIDDLRVVGDAPGCHPETPPDAGLPDAAPDAGAPHSAGGCSCQVAPVLPISRGSFGALVFFVVLGALLWRRRGS